MQGSIGRDPRDFVGLADTPEAIAAASGQVLCCGGKLGQTFADAAPEVQLLVSIFWAAALVLPIVWIRALRGLRAAPTAVARPLALLGAWRMGGPLLAAAGVAYLLMNFFVAVYAYPPVLSYRAYAPAWAEMALIAWTGLLTSGIAHLTHAHLKGRVEAATNTFGAA